MALLRINACGTDLSPHSGPDAARLEVQIDVALTRPGPVTLLVHGFRYAPGHHRHCPHQLLFAQGAPAKSGRMVSWPKHLGLGGTEPRSGLAVAFGWNARGSLRRAYGESARAGAALARLVRRIRRDDPGRRVNVLAHSLGARVALSALEHLDAGDLSRVILMSAAEYRGRAEQALATPAGRAAQMVHVTSRENDLYDCLLELLIAPPRRGDRALGGQRAAGNFRAVLLDDGATLSALARIGFRIAPPARRICHWQPYLRPGVFALYRALLSGVLSMQALDRALPDVQAAPERRWHHLLARRAPVQVAPKTPTW